MNVLIVGASRGIGAEFVRQYHQAGDMVHATVRDLSKPGEIAPLQQAVAIYSVDVRHRSEIETLATAMVDVRPDLVIHNAGIYRGHTREQLMAVNAEAPIAMIEALFAEEAIGPGTKVAMMTSQAGSRRGGSPSLGPYGESKAALNDEFRLRSGDWAAAGLIAVVVHPGWVRTDMGGPGAPVSVEESVEGMRTLFAEMSPEHNGRFLDWQGRELPW